MVHSEIVVVFWLDISYNNYIYMAALLLFTLGGFPDGAIDRR